MLIRPFRLSAENKKLLSPSFLCLFTDTNKTGQQRRQKVSSAQISKAIFQVCYDDFFSLFDE